MLVFLKDSSVTYWEGLVLSGNHNNVPNLATVRQIELAGLELPEGLKGLACPWDGADVMPLGDRAC